MIPLLQAPGAALHWPAGEGHGPAPGGAERVALGGRQPAVAPPERQAQGQLHQGAQQLSGESGWGWGSISCTLLSFDSST